MPSLDKEQALPVFEIDQPDAFGQFFLANPRQILFYLQLMAKQRSIVTAYINDGQEFLLSSIVAVDEAENRLFLEPSPNPASNTASLAAQKITLVANLERVKMQIRLPALQAQTYQGQKTLSAAIPASILRLQRREFFRLELPLATRIDCKLAARQANGSIRTYDLVLADISGGGLSLIGRLDMAESFPRDTIFPNCRLDIPGDGVIQVNLRVRKVIEISARNGQRSLRIGCEFVNLPGTRLAFIERFIARTERERNARDNGLDSH